MGATAPQLAAPAQGCADADYRQGARDRIGVSGIKGKDGTKAISTTISSGAVKNTIARCFGSAQYGGAGEEPTSRRCQCGKWQKAVGECEAIQKGDGAGGRIKGIDSG